MTSDKRITKGRISPSDNQLRQNNAGVSSAKIQSLIEKNIEIEKFLTSQTHTANDKGPSQRNQAIKAVESRVIAQTIRFEDHSIGTTKTSENKKTKGQATNIARKCETDASTRSANTEKDSGQLIAAAPKLD